MYDSREKAIRDRQWELNASRKEGLIEGEIKGKIEGEIQGMIKGEIKGKIEGEIKGKIEGKIELIRVLKEILQVPVGTESDFEGKSLEELQSLTADLQERIRQRRSS